MQYILDTHVLIWFLTIDKKLKKDIVDLISDPLNDIIISIASIWEIELKKSIGKIEADNSYITEIENVFELLDIKLPHVLQLKDLPNIHIDPFDRILISQAKAENFTLITHDKNILKYNVKTLEI